jgi:hypothetical protein
MELSQLSPGPRNTVELDMSNFGQGHATRLILCFLGRLSQMEEVEPERENDELKESGEEEAEPDADSFFIDEDEVQNEMAGFIIGDDEIDEEMWLELY